MQVFYEFATNKRRVSGLICVCRSSRGPRLQWGRICLHGADVLEDQGRCKSQKMTSDPTPPLSSVGAPAFMLVSETHACSGSLRLFSESWSQSLWEKGWLNKKDNLMLLLTYCQPIQSNRSPGEHSFHLHSVNSVINVSLNIFLFLSCVFLWPQIEPFYIITIKAPGHCLLNNND